MFCARMIHTHVLTRFVNSFNVSILCRISLSIWFLQVEDFHILVLSYMKILIIISIDFRLKYVSKQSPLRHIKQAIHSCRCDITNLGPEANTSSRSLLNCTKSDEALSDRWDIFYGREHFCLNCVKFTWFYGEIMSYSSICSK